MSGYTAKEFIGTLLVLAAVTLGVFIIRNKTPSSLSLATSTSPAVSIPPKIPVTSLQTVHSPDGTRKLVLKSQTLPSGETIYTVTASDVSGASRRTVYETTLPLGSAILLPANAWSPDNKFLFLKTSSPDGVAAFVFQGNGEPFAGGETYLDVGSLFRQRVQNEQVRDITGWDDPSLIHVMTYNADKTIGTSYWFDIWSKGFIALAHR